MMSHIVKFFNCFFLSWSLNLYKLKMNIKQNVLGSKYTYRVVDQKINAFLRIIQLHHSIQKLWYERRRPFNKPPHQDLRIFLFLGAAENQNVIYSYNLCNKSLHKVLLYTFKISLMTHKISCKSRDANLK